MKFKKEFPKASASRTKQECGNPSLQTVASLPHTCFFACPQFT